MVLRFTGQPLVDVGLAALTAFADRDDPAELTDDDLAAAADWLDRQIIPGSLLGNLVRGLLVLNSGYFYEKGRAAYVQRVLYSWRFAESQLATACSFCGAPSAYRANREDIPLMTGRAVINFSPAGEAGLPICGGCSLALHMLPLGCFKSGRGLVALHSEDPALTLLFARANLMRLRQALTLAVDPLPNLPYTRTRIAELLVQVWARLERRQIQPTAMTAYFFSNSGREPFIDIYRIDVAVLRFLDGVLVPLDPTVRAAWDRAVERSWVEPAKKADDAARRRNRLYEAVLHLPDAAPVFLRRYLLPTHCWPMVELFLRKVMLVRDDDIVRLREVGARLADYARHKSKFFYDFSRIDDYGRWRRTVLRAADDAARETGQPLLSFDEFVALFTYRDGEFWDWRLARDLITLLMIEARAVPTDDEPLFDDPLDADEA